MILNINDERRVHTPSPERIRAAFDDLELDQFLILSRSDDDYVQSYLDEDGDLLLEYREGSEDAHYSAEDSDLDRARVAGIFVAYLAGEADWNEGLAWERLEFDEDFEGDLIEDNAYLICGEEFARIPIGNGTRDADLAECGECGQQAGQFHTPSCSLEECPRCHETLQGCPCE